MPPSAAPLPLSPYRILDLTTENGYLCGRILGDLGGDVIKIEPQPPGDPGRRFGPFYRDDPDPQKSLPWWVYNTNKRSITLALESADGQALFRQLALAADFVVESLAPGYLEGLGLGYAELAKLNPRLVMTSITPFGVDGPRAGWAASDLTLQAASGLMHVAGNEDRAPLQIGVPQAQAQAGVQAALGTLVAHHHRRRTGEGQHVQVSMQAAIVNTLIDLQQHWDIDRKLGERGLSVSWGPIKHRVLFPCKDGYVTWKWFLDRGRGRRNRGFLEWMRDEGADEGVADWDFEAMTLYTIGQERVDHLERVAAKFLATRTKDEVYREARKRRFLSFPVNGPKDIVEDEQIRYRGFFQPVEHPELGARISYPGPFAKTTECSYSVRRRPPLIGEDNEAVYMGELGLTREELLTLKEAGTI